MLDTSFQAAFEKHSAGLDPNSRGFCERVFSTDPSVYENRLKAIGFQDMDRVLDAGCGFGQWALVMAGMNREVHAIDVDPSRVEFLCEMVAQGAGRVEASCSKTSTRPTFGGTTTPRFRQTCGQPSSDASSGGGADFGDGSRQVSHPSYPSFKYNRHVNRLQFGSRTGVCLSPPLLSGCGDTSAPTPYLMNRNLE